jgi:hypothetical protein
VHYRDGSYLFLGKFIGAFEVIDFYFPAVGGRPEILRLGISGIYRG